MVSKRTRFSVWWKRAGLTIRAIVLLLAVALFALFVKLKGDAGIGLFVLNVLIVILCVFALLLGRNIARLIFDRRQGIFGSRIRTRLVGAFLGITLIPLSVTFFLASGLVRQVLDGWFAPQVEAAVDGSILVARRQIEKLSGEVREESKQIHTDLLQIGRLYPKDRMNTVLDELRARYNFFSLRIVHGGAAEISSSVSNIVTVEEPSIDEKAIVRALGGEPSVGLERKGAHQFIRVYEKIELYPRSFVLVLSKQLDPILAEAISAVTDSYKEYQQLKEVRGTIQSGYIVTLGILVVLILFGALWFGFYFSRQFSEPIRRLAEGTTRVARGELEFVLSERGRDEFAILTRSFNRMLADLRDSRRSLESRTKEIEGIVSNLSVGIIRLDESLNILSVNQVAFEILGRGGNTLDELLPPEIKAVVTGGLSTGRLEEIVSFDSKKIVVTVGRSSENSVVVVLDDVTQLSIAEHDAAWQEVARRVAHEIKNPLTPMQLSAQRLKKMVDQKGLELVEIILEHIETIRRLSVEFSKNVRLPERELSLVSINSLVHATALGYADLKVKIQVILDSNVPEILIDEGQIKRALINIIDNACASFSESNPSPEVSIVTGVKGEEVVIEIKNNGSPIPKDEIDKIFTPYYSRREGGTGLGLPIAKAAVQDHGGRIECESEEDTVFRIFLPIRKREKLRRLAP